MAGQTSECSNRKAMPANHRIQLNLGELGLGGWGGLGPRRSRRMVPRPFRGWGQPLCLQLVHKPGCGREGRGSGKNV